jgi:hypothetical protein
VAGLAIIDPDHSGPRAHCLLEASPEVVWDSISLVTRALLGEPHSASTFTRFDASCCPQGNGVIPGLRRIEQRIQLRNSTEPLFMGGTCLHCGR